jgi:DNA (cytosine-5)-methyltransferase 1
MKLVDLFSGCGGMTLGFQRAGFEVVAAFDNWPQAIEIYKKNFGHPIISQNLSDVKTASKLIRKYKPEIIIGGPPCQDFSSAGKRDISLGRADLTNSFADIMTSVKPKWFVMENVEQIKKSFILKQVVKKLSSAKYGLTGIILDASLCGVPQERTRFFLIGHLNGKHNALLNIYKNKLSSTQMTVRDLFGKDIKIQYYYRHPRNYNRRAFFSVDEPSPTIRGVNRPVPPNYKLSPCDPRGIDIKNIRPLSAKERSYIQTFPKTFKFEGSKTDVEQMIGNAVPVNLASFVAKGISQFCTHGENKNGLLFSESEVTKDYIMPTQVLRK